MKNNELLERKINSRAVFDGVLLHVREDLVELPDGREDVREYIVHGGAVCVVPVTEDGNVVLERQFRYPIGKIIDEIPAGKLDFPGEDPLSAAKRELFEETGITADEWISLGTFYPSPAYTNENIPMFMCRGLRRGDSSPDDGEFLEVYELPMEKLIDEIMNGGVPDSKTQIAVLKAARLLEKERGAKGA